MQSMSNTGLNHILLSITFDAKYWGLQLDSLHLSVNNNGGHHKNKIKFNSNKTLLLLLGLWTKISWF